MTDESEGPGQAGANRLGPRIYNLFPPLCGTIEDWHGMIPRIAGMGFDWIFLNPLHLTGESGSLYAVKDYYRYNPRFVPDGEDGDALLRRFAEAAGDHGLSLMMDLVVNHTAKDSVLVEQHPDWYKRTDDGEIVSPGAYEDDGTEVIWHDLGALAYDDAGAREAMIGYWCDVVRHYVDLGIRGFRCDAAYQVPADVWKPIIDAARAVDRASVFAAETLGCTADQVEALQPAGFDLMFNSSKWWDFKARWLLKQYEQFRHFAPSIAFPESHDTERLAVDLEGQGVNDPQRIEQAYRRHYVFSAAFSTGVMMPVGYEYGFHKRLHVVETRPEDWEEPQFDLCEFIAAVHRMKAASPALNREGPQKRLPLHHHHHLTGLLQRTDDGGAWALILINRDLHKAHETRLDGEVDVEQGSEVTPGRDPERLRAGRRIRLEPGEVRVFAAPVRREASET